MRKAILFLAVFGLAAAISAQIPSSQQSNAPTSNSFKLTVLEPLPGSTIAGPDFTIVLGQPRATPPGTAVSSEERKDSLTPTYQIWVDGKDYGNLPIGQNVLHVSGVANGPHKIVVAAKNTAGELIDRKELSVTTREPQIAQAAPAPAPAYVPPAPAPAPAYVPPAPAPEPVAAPPAPTETTLPHTASRAPLALAAGLLLLAAGVALRFRS